MKSVRKGYYALRFHSRRSLRSRIYCDMMSCLFIIRCFEEFGKINVLKYSLWLFSQQLLAVITVEVCVGTLCVERRLLVGEQPAGHYNVYCRSVNGSVKLSVTFHSNHGISFLSETGSSTAAIFDACRPTCRPT